ncbi:alpha amylase, catalytic domain protein [Mycobacterium avium subsp. avium 2285 (R)]|nr:alpha amylase, catalytic domain protein [Mycobacterium avium subsp. avium 2285 (R)]
MFYQVYPRSFADSDGDGVGDIDGVTAHLDHLEQLGVDAIWLNPVTVSPMADHGYDVADPRDIDPLFGGMAAIERLIAAAHRRGIKITMDVVPNHTSSAHPWFQAALAAGPGSDARQRYFFRTAAARTASCRRTTGPRCSAGRPGPGCSNPTAIPASGICTCSTPSSPT